MGCMNVLAAVAPSQWVADHSWLPGTHDYDGLHERFGCCRNFTLGFTIARAGGFARLGWVADILWLYRTHLMGCMGFMAVRILIVGCKDMVAGRTHFMGCNPKLAVRTHFMGCSMTLAVRTLPLGCRNVLAAGSHLFCGLQGYHGCRFAFVFWVADSLWLRGTHRPQY